MKWPKTLTLVRHGQSAYNTLKGKKDKDPLYSEFRLAYERDYESPQARRLAVAAQQKYALNCGDYDTPLTAIGHEQAKHTGMKLASVIPKPDVIFYSPYLRTRETLAGLVSTWPELGAVRQVAEDRIREQEHGLSLLYNDWRVFHVFHPEQKKLRDLLGPYWYPFPQGESVSATRERVRSMFGMLIRECAGMNVLLITHHLTILSVRANLERLTPEEFIHIDEEEKPVNCGVTVYRGDSNLGADGRLVLDRYNQMLY